MKKELCLSLFNCRDSRGEIMVEEIIHIAGMDSVDFSVSNSYIKIGEVEGNLFEGMIRFNGKYYMDWIISIVVENDGKYYENEEMMEKEEKLKGKVFQYTELEKEDLGKGE